MINSHVSLLARPVFDPRYATKHMGIDSDPTKLMEDYSRNCKRLLDEKVFFFFLTNNETISELFDQLVPSSWQTHSHWP